MVSPTPSISTGEKMCHKYVIQRAVRRSTKRKNSCTDLHIQPHFFTFSPSNPLCYISFVSFFFTVTPLTPLYHILHYQLSLLAHPSFLISFLAPLFMSPISSFNLSTFFLFFLSFLCSKFSPLVIQA